MMKSYQLSASPRIPVAVFSWKLKSRHYFQYKAQKGVRSGNCSQSFLLYCKKTESLKYSSFLNNSSPPLTPAIPPLAPSSSPSSLVNIRGLAQTKEPAALQSCDLVLSPAPWRGEKQDFIPCASFSISAIVRGICRRVSSVVFLMCCYTSYLLMHGSQEQLGYWN